MAAYFRRARDLRRLLQARCGPACETDDLMQDLYVRLAGLDAGDVRDPDLFLFRLAYNLASDRRRSGLRRTRRDHLWATEDGIWLDGALVERAPAADDAVAAKRQLEAVLKLAAELPHVTRQVFTLHKLEELSHAEVAERLGISRKAVEKHMTRAFAHIGKQYSR